MPNFLIRQSQLRAIQDQLEFVTNQHFKFRIVQNDDTALLCAWQNETHVDYLLHVMPHADRTFQVALAVQKYREIVTHFDQNLTETQVKRLFDNPRECVCYLVGQRRSPLGF